MVKDLKERLLNNTFNSKLHTEMTIDEEQYAELCELLKLLAKEWRHAKNIDKELVLFLYHTPNKVRYLLDSLRSSRESSPEMVERIEEIWIELDALVLEGCLSDSEPGGWVAPS